MWRRVLNSRYIRKSLCLFHNHTLQTPISPTSVSTHKYTPSSCDRVKHGGKAPYETELFQWNQNYYIPSAFCFPGKELPVFSQNHQILIATVLEKGIIIIILYTKRLRLRYVDKEQMTPNPVLLISTMLPFYWRQRISAGSALTFDPLV